MRSTRARVALSLFLWLTAAYAAPAQHMQTAEYNPTPFGFTRFCLQKPERCAPSPRQIMRMDEARWSELDAVNTLVNRSIVADEDGSIIRPWRDEIQPGDCKDYALTKRSQLIDRGWPASTLLIAIAEVPSGGMHAVLVVVTDRGDLVLDNLGPTIANYRRLPYRWDKRMSPNNPQYWRRVISWLRSNPEPLFCIFLPGRLRPSADRALSRARLRRATEPQSRPCRVTLAVATSPRSTPSVFARVTKLPFL